MSKHKNMLTAMGFDVEVIETNGKEYLNLTKMVAESPQAENVNSLNNVCTQFFSDPDNLRFIYAAESMYSTSFKPVSIPKLIEKYGQITAARLIKETNSKLIMAKKGNVYATQIIATRFMMWLNPLFAVYAFEDYRQLKHKELKNAGRKGN